VSGIPIGEDLPVPQVDRRIERRRAVVDPQRRWLRR
jgi:hypothetical protein